LTALYYVLKVETDAGIIAANNAILVDRAMLRRARYC